MFGLSAGLLNNQMLLPFYNAVYQCSGTRMPSGKSFQVKAKHTRVTTFKDNSEIQLNSNINETEQRYHSKLLTNEEIQSILSTDLLRNMALHGPPVPVRHLINQIRNYSHMTNRKSHWMEHHSSYDSFNENKYRYPSNPSTTIVQHILNCNRNRNLLSQIHRDLRVSFHTLRSIERIDNQRSKTSSKLKYKKEPSIIPQKESSQKLNDLLSNEASEDGRKSLKVAFAEGYMAADPKATSKYLNIFKHIQNFFMIIICIAVLIILWANMSGPMFKMRVGGGNEVSPEEINVTFDDVRGIQEAKQELQEIVEFLKNPDKFTFLGAELPKGVLLVGPPGTGKTLLARAVAGEAGVPFFHAAGPEFDEILVGQGARRVRDLFFAAKARAPCVIFIDEIDSVGSKRSSSMLHPYANQTINQLLAEMDGFHKNEGVIVLGATNRRDDLDPALLRPGRFDVQVQVPIPDLAARKDIFEYYLGKIKISNKVDLDVLARGTTGFTGADIKNIVNQAALRAAADLIDCVSMKYLEDARDKVLMGPERKSRIPDEEANLITAYHESGHTLVAYFTKDALPLHKVTIIPRGVSLGHTAFIPSKEQYHYTKSFMCASMDTLMGGRAAEELIYGDQKVTSGAANDLKRATEIASNMVRDLGMSDRVGLRTFESNQNALIKSGDPLCQSMKEAIDGEINRMLRESYNRAMEILKTHTKEHKALAEALMKYETLDVHDITTIIEGKSLP